MNNKYLFFILIVIANIVLKSIYLDATPFWYDEMISVKDTQLDFGHIKHESEWDNNPPFYYYCLWVWHSIIPVSEFSSRFLSVLFVSFSIGLLYLFANKYFNHKTAIASSVLLTLSNFILFYGQETRAYALVLLLSVISTILFFKYLNRSTVFNLIVLSLINFLIIYTHYIAGLLVFLQYLIILIYYKKNSISFISIQSIIIVGLILLRFTKKQFLNIINFNKKDDFWLQTAGFNDLKIGLSELFYNPLTAIVFVAIIIFIISLYFRNKIQDNSHVKFYCFLIGVFSIVLLFTIGCFKPLFLSRYLIFAVPFATLLVVDQLFEIKKVGVFIVLFFIGFETFSLNLVKRNSSDYKIISALVFKNKKKDDVVIINTKDNLNLFLYYAYNGFLDHRKSDSICKENNIFAANDLDVIKRINYPNNSTIFLIQSFHDFKNNSNLFEKYLGVENKKLFSTKFYKGIEFNIYRRN